MFQRNANENDEAQHGSRQPGENRSGQASHRARSRRGASIPVWLMITALNCFSFGSGYTATPHELRNDQRALIQARSSDSERARQVSSSRRLQVVETCATPSESKTSTCCSPLPRLIAGETWAICASPIR